MSTRKSAEAPADVAAEAIVEAPADPIVEVEVPVAESVVEVEAVFDGNVTEVAPDPQAVELTAAETNAVLIDAAAKEPGFFKVHFEHYLTSIGLPGDRIVQVLDGFLVVAESDLDAVLVAGARIV